VYDPAGVAEPEPLGLELLLPPHPTAAMIKATVIRANAALQCRPRDGITIRNTPASKPPPLVNQKGMPAGSSAAWLVLMVRVTVPLVVELLSASGLPLIEQVMNAEAGAVQVKLTEPL
jgi:hypothetical protein